MPASRKDLTSARTMLIQTVARKLQEKSMLLLLRSAILRIVMKRSMQNLHLSTRSVKHSRIRKINADALFKLIDSWQKHLNSAILLVGNWLGLTKNAWTPSVPLVQTQKTATKKLKKNTQSWRKTVKSVIARKERVKLLMHSSTSVPVQIQMVMELQTLQN
jgi:hypothetical protein